MVRTMRDEILATIDAIRPALQADGGDIEFHDVDETTGVVSVALKGACAGCPSSNTTLEFGVQRIMRDRIEGVTAVVNITDNSSHGGACH
jgi:Fe-S cluster biogenesis protein NfuA